MGLYLEPREDHPAAAAMGGVPRPGPGRNKAIRERWAGDWLALAPSACQRPASTLAPVMGDAYAAASLRKAAAGPKTSAMARDARRARYAWYRVISHLCPRRGSDATAGSGTGFHFQPVIHLSPVPGPASPGSMNSPMSTLPPIWFRTKRSPARVSSTSWRWAGAWRAIAAS